jgi:hypothetical protein
MGARQDRILFLGGANLIIVQFLMIRSVSGLLPGAEGRYTTRSLRVCSQRSRGMSTHAFSSTKGKKSVAENDPGRPS